MINRAWRLVLLIVSLVATIWPDILGVSTWWITLIALVVLLIGEIMHEGGRAIPNSTVRKVTRSSSNRRRR